MPRSEDGVRGLFALSHYKKGQLLMKIPLQCCAYPNARYCSPLPSYGVWRSRLSERLCDFAPLQLECSMSSEDTASGVVTFSLSQFEAALVFPLALEYFLRRHIKNASLSRWPTESMVLNTFAMSVVHHYGSEAEFVSPLQDHSSQDLHSCIEQVARAMVDRWVEVWATDDERRIAEAHMEELSWIFLSAIHAVRARVLCLPLAGHGSLDLNKGSLIYAPLLTMINHGAAADRGLNCAAVISLEERQVVVRALRDISTGEEFLMNYCSMTHPADSHQRTVLHPTVSLEEQHAWDRVLSWEARYQCAR